MKTEYRKWLSLGTGVGIEVGADDLQVSIVRVRPSGITVLGSAKVAGYRHRPAAEWGAELNAFLRKVGCGHIPAAVLLPRNEVVVRQVMMPGVTDKDLTSAIQLQIDSLHPFAEDDVVFAWARLGGTPAVLVGIARREVVDRYSTLFAEAGLKIASFTFSAAAVYSALRVLNDPPRNFLALHQMDSVLEVYGESESRPLFSAGFDSYSDRAVALASSELRLAPDTEAMQLSNLLPKPSIFPSDHDPETSEFEQHSLPYATALAGACPWLSIDANLLPSDQRKSSSRIRLVPTIALTSILLVLAGALLAHSTYQEKRYLAAVLAESKKLEPQARRAEALDKDISRRRARTQLIDDFRRRARYDMDTLGEVTKLLPPPGWVNGLDLTRTAMQISGEVDQAAVLLEAFDKSGLFQNSEFMMPIAKAGSAEQFRIKADREGSPK